MKFRTYPDAGRFLQDTQIALESNEAANSLMLGVCLRLARYPERIKTPPCLKTVEDENGLVLAAMMTPPHNLVVYGHRGDLDGAAQILVEALDGEGWAVPGVLGPSEVATKVATKWAEGTHQTCDLEQRQRLYKLQQGSSPVPCSGTGRLATGADLEWVAECRYGFHRDIFGEADRGEERRAAERAIANGDTYLWQDRMPVSMAMTTRPTRNGISIGLVYTPPEWRGRGYATACVGALSRLLLDTGWQFCTLFANLSNVPANRVYDKIGYKPVCDYDQYAFHKNLS